jgi:thioredoxin reductase (NADPH)
VVSKPFIFLVDDEPHSLSIIERELVQRYAANYQIICETSPKKAIDRLAVLRQSGGEVAVLLTDCLMPEMNGAEFLVMAHRLFPQAKRGLLVQWGDLSCADTIFDSIALNKIDSFTAKPVLNDADHPNEEFHYFISEFLIEWSREHRPQYEVFRIVAEQWDRRSYELRDLFRRNNIQFRFYDVQSETGRALLEQASMQDADLPVVLCFDGQVLANPSNADLARVVGARTTYEPPAGQAAAPVDVLIVGAGPAGLSAAMNSASEGLKTVIIEREAMGGQAGMSSRIRNYLGFPTGIAGDELMNRAYRQGQLFGAETVFTQQVTGLLVRDNTLGVILSDGSEITARVVLLAMGVAYRRLEVPGLEKLVGAGVFYGAVGSEALALSGKEVFVVGGANSAGQAALHLAKYARQVTMVVRGASLAASMSDYLIQEIEGRENIRLLLSAEVLDGEGAYNLEKLVIHHKLSGETETLPADALFAMIGATPHTGWLPDSIQRDPAGYIRTGASVDLQESWPLQRPPYILETSLPGVFAAGDVRARSVKRVASAVGEGAMCVQYIHQYLEELKQKSARGL